MPEFRVMVEERHTEVVEELHHAYREMYVEVEYRIIADDEDEAVRLVEEGHGEELDREYNEGEYFDSEYWETLEVIDSTFEESEIVNVTNTESNSTRAWTPTYYVPSPLSALTPKPSWEV